jgi:hypothetical protein
MLEGSKVSGTTTPPYGELRERLYPSAPNDLPSFLTAPD